MIASCISTIVITGATGFVARNLRAYLASKDVSVVSISRSDFDTFDSNETKIITSDYTIDAIPDADVLIHLIGVGRQSPAADYTAIHVNLTKNIVDLCKRSKIKKIIYLSGLGVSPDTSLALFISKYKAEQAITGSSINYTIFRPSYIIGQDDHLTQYLKKQQKQHNNSNINIPGSGKYHIQPIHIDDVSRIIYESTHSERFRDVIVDLVGPDIIPFKQYVASYVKNDTSGTTITKVSLEKAYHDAITNKDSKLSVDDLCILIGSFTGNHKKLEQLSHIKLKSVIGNK